MRSPIGQRVTVTCEYCKKVVEIHPYRIAKFHFCSWSCRSKANPKARKGINKICEYCGMSFYVSNCRKDTSRFCSHSCRSKKLMGIGENARFWNGGDITFTCIVCKKETTRKRGNTSGTYQFCSTQCHDIYRQKRVDGTCANCGKTFTIQKSRAHRGKREYCSLACYFSYAVGEKSAQWRGGNKEYPPAFSHQFKQAIRERDNFTCAICKEYGDNIHHINYVKDDTTPENCITLCRSCHCKTNFNREYWIEYFSC